MRAPQGSDEPLILVDEGNRAVGAAPKQAVHLRGLLHRAFSIFMVVERGGILLLQLRNTQTRYTYYLTCAPVVVRRNRAAGDQRPPTDPVHQLNLLRDRQLLQNHLGAQVRCQRRVHPRPRTKRCAFLR